MTLFDRYLMFRYWHTFIITFVAMFGLYVVIDAFSNFDEFTKLDRSVGMLLLHIGRYYLYQAFVFFNTVGGLISTLAAVLVLALVQRHGELNPILSAGVPTYRLAWPLIFGALVLNGLLIANQELLIPSISTELQSKHGQDATSSDRIKPTYDHSTHILIASGRIFLQTRTLEDGEFVLPVPKIAKQITNIRAQEATYHEKRVEGRSGWLLKGATPRFDEISLTPIGRQTIYPGEQDDEIFVATDINFEQLISRNKVYAYLSTVELLDRVKNPAYGIIAARAQSLHLHTRFTKPLMNVLLVLMVIPFVVRRESRGLVVNLALCVGAILVVLAAGQAFEYLATANLVRLDLAAWAPVILCGTSCAWFAAMVRT